MDGFNEIEKCVKIGGLNQYTMKFTRLSALFLSLLITLVLWSCGGSKKDEKSSEEFKQAEESLKDQIKDVVYNIPSPTEIPYLLEATGAEFNPSLINDRKKVDSYAARNDKAALNLGVYAADIGYLTSYDKTQEAIDYLNATKTLADNLGVIGSFDADILKKFEANIANKDSLAGLLNETVQKTDRYLKDDNRNKLASLMVTGSFVEGLYISTGLIKSYPKNILPDDARNLVLTPLMRVVLQQEKSVSELLSMLSTVEQTDPITTIVADLTALDASYRALNIDEQIKNNRADLVLSDKNLSDITNIVEKLRKAIVE
jgi:hypothetical protein